jgi:hypothetical protein
MNEVQVRKRRTALIVSINLLVAGLHFVTGPGYRGPFPLFVNGYLIDILLPFSLYFLLCLFESALLKAWYVKALLVFGVGFIVESAQYLGYELLGSTFDPLDYAAYALGVLLAVCCDLFLFPLLFDFWKTSLDRASA